MAFDRREAILSQIFTILQGVQTADSTIKTVARDTGDWPATDPTTQNPLLPALLLYDGDEKAVPPSMATQFQVTGQQPPSLVLLLPQIFVILMPRKNPTNIGVAQELSQRRMQIFGAVLGDQNLKLLLGPNGYIQLRGCYTDMKSGRDMQGQMQIDLEFRYTLNPAELR